MVCTYEGSHLEDLAYLLKCNDVDLGENAMAWVIWVSQGCVDFKPVVHSTEGTSGQAYPGKTVSRPRSHKSLPF